MTALPHWWVNLRDRCMSAEASTLAEAIPAKVRFATATLGSLSVENTRASHSLLAMATRVLLAKKTSPYTSIVAVSSSDAA